MSVLKFLGRALARHINQPVKIYETFSVTDPGILARVIQPCDVLLVEGDRRVSTAIKYLTQSTWSHAAIYVGGVLDEDPGLAQSRTLVEADIEAGVIAVPISKYAGFNTRISRPVGLSKEDQETVIQYVTARLGYTYDMKNIVDLARYLLPTPPVPTSLRRRMLALGSGEPTQAICSSLIAQAFQAVRYPILPHIEEPTGQKSPWRSSRCVQEILRIRHHSLFVPRDFDISPYFRIVKPTLESGFDYRKLVWGDRELFQGKR